MSDMSDFEQWLIDNMPSGTVIGDPKWWAPKLLQAAKQSIQGEAVGEALNGRCFIYGDHPVHNLHIENGTPLYTHAPDSAARIAEQSAEIARLTKELEEARNKSRNLVELVLVAREWYWVPCSQASDYVNHELFPRNQKFPGTNQNNNKTPMWNAIDTAIRQIGGGE